MSLTDEQAQFYRKTLLLTLSGVRAHKNVLQLWLAESGDPLSPPLPVPWFGLCSFEGRDPVAVVGVSGYGYKLLTRWSLALVPDQRPPR